MKWRKLAYALTGAVFTLILSFTWISWADNQPEDVKSPSEDKVNANANPTEASNKAGEISFLDYENRKVIIFDGKQKHTFQLSEQTQVLINDKQADLQQIELGAQAEIIQNSAGDVRYLRIEQKEIQESAAQDRTTSQDTIATVKPITTNQAAAKQPAQSVSFPWEKWKLDLHQGDVKVKLEWEDDDAEVEWKTSGRELKLEGDQARAFIQSWYQKSDLSAQNEQEELVYAILKSFDIQTEQPFECTIEWKKNGQSGKWTVHPKDKEKDKSKDKEKKDDDD